MKLKELALITKSIIQGDESNEIESLAATPKLASTQQLALIFPNRFSKAEKLLKESQALVFLISNELEQDKEFQAYRESRKKDNLNFIIHPRPKYALQKLISHFEKERFKPASGIHPSAIIDPSAKIHPSASIGALTFIGPNTIIGAGTIIHPRVTIGAYSSIGESCLIRSGVVIEDYVEIHNRVIIHPNTVIGADGYSYITEEPTNLEKMQKRDFNFSMDRQIQHKINSIGNVIIYDDVEIGANTCIDRGTIGPTVIGEGTKIDNLCQIAHNVQIGKDALIISQTGIAGSARIGDRVTMAGASGCGDGVEIGNDAVVGAFSAANSDVDPFMPVLGTPAIAYGEFLRRQRAIVRLPKQQEELRKLKAKVDEMSKTTSKL